MLGSDDGKWAQEWRNLGSIPGITVEEKLGQGKALQKTPEMLRAQQVLADQTKGQGQPLPEQTEMFRSHEWRNLGSLPGMTVEEKIGQGKALPERTEFCDSYSYTPTSHPRDHCAER